MGWTHREEWMAYGREKYWNGIREDVKESKVDRVEDGLICIDKLDVPTSIIE
jgi:hypothetical protein